MWKNQINIYCYIVLIFDIRNCDFRKIGFHYEKNQFWIKFSIYQILGISHFEKVKGHTIFSQHVGCHDIFSRFIIGRMISGTDIITQFLR